MAEARHVSLYETIGGQETVRKVTTAFYNLIATDQRYTELRALHSEDLTETRESLEGFLTAWMGGPRDWFTRRPGICIMSAHAGVRMTPETTQQWIEAMARAMGESGVNQGMALRICLSLARMASAMSRS